MKIYRYFSFWLLILFISICLFNLLGFDDKIAYVLNKPTVLVN